MIELFKQGGIVMWPLLGFSVVSFAVIIERGVFYFVSRGGRSLASFREKYAQWLSEGLTPKNFEEKVFMEGVSITRRNEARLPVLATISSVSTLTGLFGTVLGMIEVFQRLAAIGGKADIALLSNGIWVALLTTAFGLIVAVPSLLAHRFFSNIAALRSEDLDLLIAELSIEANASNHPEGVVE